MKLCLQEARPHIAEELGISPDELARLHRRFEVVPAAQAQVDWGDEDRILTHVASRRSSPSHGLVVFKRPVLLLHHWSGPGDVLRLPPAGIRALRRVPMSIVYDRTKTVVRRHVAPGEAVPLHPELRRATPRERCRRLRPGGSHTPSRGRRPKPATVADHPATSRWGLRCCRGAPCPASRPWTDVWATSR